MGVDSGLPDFRGTEGFWKAYPAIQKLGYTFEQMATPISFVDNPELAWAFYGHRLNLYRNTTPHEGFNLLLEYGNQLPEGYGVITSNVDGHFQKAGFNNDRILEIHGSINHFQCLINECHQGIYKAPTQAIEIDSLTFKADIKKLPRCPICNSPARPNIMMFNDWGWKEERTLKQSNKMNLWINSLKSNNKKVLIIEVGAGTAIPSIRLKTQELAIILNAKYYRVNPRETNVDASGIPIKLNALDGIKNILLNLS